MSSKNYTLKFKSIISIQQVTPLKECLETIFKNENKINYSFADEKKTNHDCLFEIFTLSEDYAFGRFGEIKESHSQNAVVLVNNVEHEDANFKYHVQFLISYKTMTIVFIFNNNAICFEEAFVKFVADKTNTLEIFFQSIISNKLIDKVKKAKKLKFISTVRSNPNEFKSLFGSFWDDDLYEVEVKLNLKKKKGIDREKIVNFINQHQNDNLFTIAFTDEDGVEQCKKFTETVFYKAKKIPIDSNDINNREEIFKLLEVQLKQYEQEQN